jgi:hypothetical protein
MAGRNRLFKFFLWGESDPYRHPGVRDDHDCDKYLMAMWKPANSFVDLGPRSTGIGTAKSHQQLKSGVL